MTQLKNESSGDTSAMGELIEKLKKMSPSPGDSDASKGYHEALQWAIYHATSLLKKELEDKKKEAVAAIEWVGEQGLFNGLSPDNIRRWHKMVGNSKPRTSEELYQDFKQSNQ